MARQRSPVQKMLNEYKLIVERGEKQKKKRKNRMQANIKVKAQNNFFYGGAVDPKEETHRTKILDLSTCHAGKQVDPNFKAEEKSKTHYKINELKYGGKQAPISK